MTPRPRRSRRLGSWLYGLAGVVLGAALMLVGLAQAGRLRADKPEVLVALAQLLDVEHRRIDLLLANGDAAGAITALEALRGGAWPSRTDGGDAALELRHDVYGRLLRLRLDHPEIDPQAPERLLEIANEGLGGDHRELETNPFTARLVALRGEVLELEGRDEQALSAYEEALEMNSVLLERELADQSP